ncbi:MAG TPA: hypothetical protein VM095_02725 [Pyrinomonadaceae bacterium]|nr:hypothetical protein [Pyrinomonadaceae bacterium]
MKSRVLFIVVLVVLVSVSAFAKDYSFKVTNTTDKKITKILVSEDGEEYGDFNIGSGIAPGKTVTLAWDSSTNGENCEQYIKAVFADGEESEAQQFDFCEEGVVIEFQLNKAGGEASNEKRAAQQLIQPEREIAYLSCGTCALSRLIAPG